MLKLLLVLFLLIHGLIHILGFAKAFHYGQISQLTRIISKPMGVLWLLAALLFIVSCLLFVFKKSVWWMVGLPAVLLSQFLIFTVWSDAKFGTIANSILLIAFILGYGNWQFEREYKRDLAIKMQRGQPSVNEMLTEGDLQHLPLPVQRYLRYAGVLNKPKIKNFKIVFDGQMREKGKDWFSFTSEQYNFIKEEPTRLFFMQAKMYGITVPGYHAYKNGKASMQVRLFGLFPVVNSKPGELDKAETVTLFNDMCLLAPSSLIDPAIRWQALDSLSVKAAFTVHDQTIAATLYFNEKGQLINFISDDRYAIADKMQYRFSTPVSNYINFNGYNLPAYGEAIWHYPDGAFAYGKFQLREIQYNVQ
jgi:hypothetical protein